MLTQAVLLTIVFLLGHLLKIDDSSKERIVFLASYMSDRKNSFKFYTLMYIFCQFLNFLNTILQIYIIIYFTGDAILDFSLIFKNQFISNHVIFDVFPTQIICLLQKYGSAGAIGKQNK